MSRRLLSITLDNLDDLPPACRECVFWELDPLAGRRAGEDGSSAQRKESWVSATLLEWGSCGKVLYVDGVAVGYALYAPPALLGRAGAFPTSPVSDDAVLLAALSVLPEFEGAGLGRVIVQGVVKDLQRRGVRAVEAFGDARAERPPRSRGLEPGCLIPADFLLAVGFKTVRPHLRYPRLRLEMRNVVSWRDDVEGALERLLGSMGGQDLVPRPAWP
ncbi:hypothetical protein EV189_0455 [Motilibacter rhizosphaerae]|uniref:N-acetyltransferase domain-containing protein n=1 Tax=Motilibacter rhizosphaerae TaxID=598652 RepID=A0A4Q7NVE9_9ACTN|nr:GNAT family N-acetyltransferase [Motilibacter rhizosphaerae]RZS91221.1 hypothetical protein EV189_0455 [Motilibacter rhizosphaerae]